MILSNIKEYTGVISVDYNMIILCMDGVLIYTILFIQILLQKDFTYSFSQVGDCD